MSPLCKLSWVKEERHQHFTDWPGPGEHGKTLLKCNAIGSKAVMIHNFNRIENMKFGTSFLISIVHKRNATFLKVNCEFLSSLFE